MSSQARNENLNPDPIDWQDMLQSSQYGHDLDQEGHLGGEDWQQVDRASDVSAEFTEVVPDGAFIDEIEDEGLKQDKEREEAAKKKAAEKAAKKAAKTNEKSGKKKKNKNKK